MTLEQNYRNTLRRILVERCQKNPKYSLRAFARDIGLDPARLSDVLNGKRGLSRASCLPIAHALGMSPREVDRFCAEVEALHSRSRVAREAARSRLKEMEADQSGAQLSLDAFRVVSDWHHFAILQLLKLPQSKNTPEWIVRALGIKRIEAEDALERLERLELVERRGEKYSVTNDSVFTPDGVASDAIKKFHEQITQKALTALFTQPIQERDFINTLLPLDSGDIDLLRKRVRKFNREICEEFSNKPTVDRVYSFSVQFFNLTPNLKEMEK